MMDRDRLRRFARAGWLAFELTLLTALILAARCANYQDVFVRGSIYFSDADCYSRMTRARLCALQPGLVLRHHDFENYPTGTTPHTTVPFDYLIVGLSKALQPFSERALDLAGALISPILGLMAGWFLWWWARQLKVPFRGCMLLLFALSPIIVHGTELGRPDHQSLLMLLVVTALGAEWGLWKSAGNGWAIVSGASWGLALWVSLYEPIILLSGLVAAHLAFGGNLRAPERRPAWYALASIVFVAALIERRSPEISALAGDAIFQHWAGSIGELASVRVLDPIWFRWVGGMLLVTPILFWLTRKKEPRGFIISSCLLLALTYGLTIWQARWGYFFASVFVLMLPLQLSAFPRKWIARAAFVVCLWPLLRAWDERLFPTETESALRTERREEAVAWREASLQLAGPVTAPIMAPWWLTPSAVYWSGQPAVAGSSHESLPGIADSARFFLSPDQETACRILRERKAGWVMAYDADRAAATSAKLLGVILPPHPFCAVLDQSPASVPRFLVPTFRNSVAKLYRVCSE